MLFICYIYRSFIKLNNFLTYASLRKKTSSKIYGDSGMFETEEMYLRTFSAKSLKI